jgi:hypothetical protein
VIKSLNFFCVVDGERKSWVISWTLNYLEPDDKIRIGVEGDPCSRFRSTDESPCATVEQILERREDGFLRFRAVMDSGEKCEFTNRSFDPEFVWELHPDSVDTFSKRVNGYRGSSSYSSTSNPKMNEIEEKVKDMEEKISMITKDMSERLSSLEEAQQGTNFRGSETGEEIDGLKESEKVFRETMASTIRALAGDTLRIAKGEPVEFAHQYVDRYDLALEERSASSYRGASPSKRKNTNQDEKWSFAEFKRGDSASIRECTELTDD